MVESLYKELEKVIEYEFITFKFNLLIFFSNY